MTIGSKIYHFKTLPSTNSYAADLIRNKTLPEGSVISARYQSAGRGNLDNKWESEDGKNLLISIILFPSMIKPVDQFVISMAVSLGICDFLKRYSAVCSVKWPNDIYIKNDKIAGILIESSIMGNTIEHSIVGIGLNINQKKFLSDAPNPISLALVTRKIYDLEKCLDQLTSDLDKRYNQLFSQDFINIRDEYISNLYRLNEWHNFRDSRGIYMGKIISVAGNGMLVIERVSGGTSEYSFKEIEFIL